MSNPRFLDNVGGRKAMPGDRVTEIQDDLVATEAWGGEVRALLEGLLAVIVNSAGACAGAVRVCSPDGRELHIAGAVGLPAQLFALEGHVPANCGVCGAAVHGGGFHTADTGRCASVSGSRFFLAGCKRVVAIPLENGGSRIGVLNLFFDNNRKIGGEAELALRSFADLIGVSLGNARQARENRRTHLIAERQAISNEIHDSLAQTLAFGRMRMSVLQEALRKGDEALAQKCISDVNEALDCGKKSVRELITHFRCQMDPLGLSHALQMLADDFSGRSGIELEYLNRVAEFAMSLEHELQIYNIVREVLANIAAHSGASHAYLRVTREDGRYVFAMGDNGSGMPDSEPPNGHYGLSIMRERANRIGAEIELESTKGQGTRVRLLLAAG